MAVNSTGSPRPSAAKISASWAADGKRAAGSFSRLRRTMASSVRPSLVARMSSGSGGGATVRCLMM